MTAKAKKNWLHYNENVNIIGKDTNVNITLVHDEGGGEI